MAVAAVQHEGSGNGTRPKSHIFGIPIDLGRPDELLRMVTGWVGSGQPKRVMYVNAHVLNQSQEDPELAAALSGADLVYCDGYGRRIAPPAPAPPQAPPRARAPRCPRRPQRGRPRVLRRLRRAHRGQGARAADAPPHDRCGLDLV